MLNETVNDLIKIENVYIKGFMSNFYHIVVVIEKSKDLYEMKLEELHASLEGHELRLKQRN